MISGEDSENRSQGFDKSRDGSSNRQSDGDRQSEQDQEASDSDDNGHAEGESQSHSVEKEDPHKVRGDDHENQDDDGDENLGNLYAMFPNFDRDVVRDFYEMFGKDSEKTSEFLLMQNNQERNLAHGQGQGQGQVARNDNQPVRSSNQRTAEERKEIQPKKVKSGGFFGCFGRKK